MKSTEEMVKYELEEALGILIQGDITSVVYDMLKDTQSLGALIKHLGGKPRKPRQKKEMRKHEKKMTDNSMSSLFANSPVIGGS